MLFNAYEHIYHFMLHCPCVSPCESIPNCTTSIFPCAREAVLYKVIENALKFHIVLSSEQSG